MFGLFDKKTCDICGGKIGIFGNRKVEDGNVCKDCAGKLSPWFSDRRRSTLEDIKAKTEALTEKFHIISTKLYQEAQAQQAAAAGDAAQGGDAADAGDNIQDADFEVVDDDK